MDEQMKDRLYGVAVGAAVGDALGMALEFGPAIPEDRLVRTMKPGRLPAGSFTDDTEMALAVAESLISSRPLRGSDLSRHLVAWYEKNPPDIGVHTRKVLGWLAEGMPWRDAMQRAEEYLANSAPNGSLMRSWPVAIAWWNDPIQLVVDSELQSKVTHPHIECVQGSVLINRIIYQLIHGDTPHEALDTALKATTLPAHLRQTIEQAPHRQRSELENSGWVRHTLESAVWGLLTTTSFEEAVVQVVNLGQDADTVGAVVGAMAGAAYGLSAIPEVWKAQLRGEWPVGSGNIWHTQDFIQLTDRLVEAPF